MPVVNHTDERGCAAWPALGFWALLRVFLRLGLTAFGGPVAHLAYFQHEFVVRRRWLDEAAYAQLLALCQFLPGPASSQAAMGIGLMRGGLAGALAAWLGFTLPSAVILFGLALGTAQGWFRLPEGALHGLKIVAVAVVAQAVWQMMVRLCPDGGRKALMLATACCVWWWPMATTQIGLLAAGAAYGLLWLRSASTRPMAETVFVQRISRRKGAALLLLCLALLLGLPYAAAGGGVSAVGVFAAFYRAGALVFGGGHVVLPWLQQALVPTGWVSTDDFMAAYAAAQAMPGPLFAVAAFLGGSLNGDVSAGWGALLALTAIFLPGSLLLLGVWPFWADVQRQRPVQAALAGVNAAVVGLLLAAWYQPLWQHSVHSAADVAAVLLVVWLLYRRLPVWLLVVLAALVGALVAA